MAAPGGGGSLEISLLRLITSLITLVEPGAVLVQSMR